MTEPTMPDAEALAWLREDERDSRMSGEAHVSLLQRRLALARREAAEAVAAEREACAALVEGIARGVGDGAPAASLALSLTATRIRSRA